MTDAAIPTYDPAATDPRELPTRPARPAVPLTHGRAPGDETKERSAP